MKTYITSDTHFGHELMVKEGFRPFKTTEEMDEHMIYEWNKRVTPEDKVFFLGDFCMQAKHRNKLSQLNGDITLVRGNHDSKTFTHINSLELDWFGVTLLLLHKPQDAEAFPNHKIVLHGHVHKSGIRDFTPIKGVTYANVNLEYHNYKPKLISEIVGMIRAKKEAPWIVYG